MIRETRRRRVDADEDLARLREPSRRHPHLPPFTSELIQRFGPFLPYTVIFGPPANLEDTPYWGNLLQRGFWGWEYWGGSVEAALRMAAVGIESLMATSSPEQVRFLALVPRPVETSWLGDHWLGVYPQGQWIEAWQRIREEWNRRVRDDIRGPEHWVVWFIGVGRHIGQIVESRNGRIALHHPNGNPVREMVSWLFQEGPRWGLWPVIVDTYTAWDTWHALVHVQPHVPPRVRLLAAADPASMARVFGKDAAFPVPLLERHQALVVSRQGVIPIDIPRTDWPYQRFWTSVVHTQDVLVVQPMLRPPALPHKVERDQAPASPSRPSRTPARPSVNGPSLVSADVRSPNLVHS